MNKIIPLLLIVLTPLNALADDAKFLEKGQIAPFDGFLLDREKATKVRLLDIDYQEALKTKDYLQKDNEVYIQRLDNMKNYNDRLAKENVELRENSIWSKLGFFVLGALVTTGIAYGVTRATK
jgi:hypothetical protein